MNIKTGDLFIIIDNGQRHYCLCANRREVYSTTDFTHVKHRDFDSRDIFLKFMANRLIFVTNVEFDEFNNNNKLQILSLLSIALREDKIDMILE